MQQLQYFINEAIICIILYTFHDMNPLISTINFTYLPHLIDNNLTSLVADAINRLMFSQSVTHESIIEVIV